MEEQNAQITEDSEPSECTEKLVHLFAQIRKLAQQDPQLEAYIEKYPNNPDKIAERRHQKKTQALISAIKSGNPTVVENLCKDIKNLNITGSNNPLGQAVIADNIEIAEILIYAGADVNYKPNRNFSVAVDIKSPEMLDFLIQNNVDLNLGTVHGRNLLMQRVEQSDIEMVKKLVKHFDIEGLWYETTPLLKAIINNDFNMVKTLLELNADANHRTREDAPLELALQNGYEDIANLLRRHGASDVVPKNY